MAKARIRTSVAAALVALLSAGSLLLAADPARAESSGLVLTATIDDRPVAGSDGNDPIALRPDDPPLVTVTVTNHGARSVDVGAVGLSAHVLGIPFVSYTTLVNLTVAPGETQSRSFALNVIGLDGLAIGLLPASLTLLTAHGDVLASQDGALDVRGDLWSVYGVFGLAVGGITVLLLITLMVRLVRRTLPESRWARAVRFAAPGLGLGLTTTFTLSVLRVLVPSSGAATGLLVGGLAVGAGLGYLTPNPADESDRDELDELDVVDVGSLVPGFSPPPAAPPTIDLTRSAEGSPATPRGA